MASRKKKITNKPKQSSTGPKTPVLLLGALIVIVLLSGIIFKLLLFQDHDTITAGTYTTVSPVNESLEGLVQLVASEFRCACGGCGELPLIDCNCDMPRGAVEEKRFISEKLKEGLSPERVIERVEELYGLRMKG